MGHLHHLAERRNDAARRKLHCGSHHCATIFLMLAGTYLTSKQMRKVLSATAPPAWGPERVEASEVVVASAVVGALRWPSGTEIGKSKGNEVNICKIDDFSDFLGLSVWPGHLCVKELDLRVGDRARA